MKGFKTLARRTVIEQLSSFNDKQKPHLPKIQCTQGLTCATSILRSKMSKSIHRPRISTIYSRPSIDFGTF